MDSTIPRINLIVCRKLLDLFFGAGCNWDPNVVYNSCIHVHYILFMYIHIYIHIYIYALSSTLCTVPQHYMYICEHKGLCENVENSRCVRVSASAALLLARSSQSVNTRVTSVGYVTLPSAKICKERTQPIPRPTMGPGEKQNKLVSACIMVT